MLDMLLIPIILPSIDVTEEPAIPSQVEVAYSYQDRNPYKCVELINTYLDGKNRTDVTSGSIADKSFRPSKQAVSEENAENSESQNSDDSVTPSENQEEESLKTEEEQPAAAEKESQTDAAAHVPQPESDNTHSEHTAETGPKPSALSQTEDMDTNVIRQVILDDMESEKEQARSDYLFVARNAEKERIFNALMSCKIKAGIARNDEFRNHYSYRKNTLTSAIYKYNKIRTALQNKTIKPSDINFIQNPSELNRENYQKIKPYIQLIELYKLSESNNLKAVSFFENNINDQAFNSYPESVKNAFWIQGFNLYYGLNHKNIAYYLLNLVEKNYSGKTQYTYTNAILAKQLSMLAMENKDFEYAEEHLSRYVSVIEHIPEEQMNYIDNLLQLSDLKIKTGHSNDAVTLLKKADHLINYTTMDKADEERFKGILSHLYIEVHEYERALFYLDTDNHNYSFDSEKTISLLRLIDLAIALNGTNQTSNAAQLMKTIGGYLDKLPDQYKPLYYHTNAAIEATQGNYAEAYKNVEAAYGYGKNLYTRLPDNQSHNLPPPTFYQNYLPHNNNIVSVPIRMMIVMLSGSTILFLIVVLAFLRYYNKSKELEREIDRIEDDYPQSLSSDIKNYNDFMNFIIRQSMNYHQSDNDMGTKNIDLINNKDIYQIFIPGFTDLSIKRGYKQAQNQRNAFIDKLQNLLHIASDIYVISDARYVIVTKPNADMDAFTMSNTIINKIEQVLKELHIDPVVNAGIISYPFINSAPYSLESTRIFELLSLALAGARSIADHNQQSSFVRLNANRLDKSSIQDGDTYARAINCIKKGSIKTISLPEESQIDWQQIQEDTLL